jgi:tetratricopeptide (TPR) repeat protein
MLYSCRWFARSFVATIAQLANTGCEAGLLQASVTIGERPSTFDKLLAFLRQDRFGGHVFYPDDFLLMTDFAFVDLATRKGLYNTAMKTLGALAARPGAEVYQYCTGTRLAQLCVKMGRPANAIRTYEALLTVSLSRRPEVHAARKVATLKSLSALHLDASDHDRALGRLLEAIELPQSEDERIETRLQLCFAYQSAERFPDMLRHAQLAIAALRVLDAARPERFRPLLVEALLAAAVATPRQPAQAPNGSVFTQRAMKLANEALKLSKEIVSPDPAIKTGLVLDALRLCRRYEVVLQRCGHAERHRMEEEELAGEVEELVVLDGEWTAKAARFDGRDMQPLMGLDPLAGTRR